MMRFLITAGCALAFGTAATAQTDTATFDDLRDEDEVERVAPSGFGDDAYPEDTYDDEGASDFGDEVDTTNLRVLTPEDDPNGLGLEEKGPGDVDAYAVEPEDEIVPNP